MTCWIVAATDLTAADVRLSVMARRLSSSCSRAVASSSFPSPLLRRIYTCPSRSLLLASAPRTSYLCRLPPPCVTRCSFRTLAAAKGSSSPLSSVSPSKQSQRKRQEEEMTIASSVKLAGGTLSVCGRTVLSDVPDAVVASSAAAGGAVDGVFLGADFAEPASRHVVSLGALRGVRFMACFRFKLWWMAQRMGEKGGDVPHETQFLLVESRGAGAGGEDAYVVFLPLVQGAFRASLQGGAGDELELCVESGDPDTRAASFERALFVGATESDPFAAIAGAVAAAKSALKTFRLRLEKKLPGIVDYFGWCTWDAFYQDVTQEGVEAGLRSLIAGGAPPKFVIIDDGWQSVGTDQDTTDEPAGEDKPPRLSRLTGIKENSKFQNIDDPAAGIKTVVRAAKEEYGLKYVYVWHAITGYWGGVRPGAAGTEHYRSSMQFPKISPGVVENEPGMKTDVLTTQGLGLVHPRAVYRFYDELHAYLAAAGVDGVKVDVQCILETLGAGHGGRVQLTRQYHQALDASIAKNFPENGIIACMSHNTDALYCSKQTAVVRASDDFYPSDPVSHTIHIASVSYNSVFLGEFMLPDWDMFHSLHPAGDYHGSARAISGGPVYVSDAPGKHNFELLKKIILPDGSVLRARLPGRPTKDCLFIDPTRDGVSLLKIWNMNKFTGVLGVYNCQGAAWSSVEKKNIFHQTGTEALTCGVKGSDVHLISEAATDPEWNGDCAVYLHASGHLVVLPNGAALPISLKVLEHDVLTVSPIKDLAPGFRFAPIGLVDMFNGGAAVEGLTYHLLDSAKLVDGNGSTSISEAMGLVCMEVRGCGRFGAYSSVGPRKCMLGSAQVDFSYDSCSGLVILQLEAMPKERVHRIVVEL
ncbi:probable galactinol--sucrose galactosyltransferase 6 isoform X2 [Phragmites australis]|uniref:probable galactinol--sucrose galactosyltransferase 6 isoform X2 n=1 Tax=Phragmites australis TaxID=29695 RepID=UPI002D77A49C|nr:probable galactinol--sucrose galactosyltransferase 6 isoform X2 [Phragmites australis]